MAVFWLLLRKGRSSEPRFDQNKNRSWDQIPKVVWLVGWVTSVVVRPKILKTDLTSQPRDLYWEFSETCQHCYLPPRSVWVYLWVKNGIPGGSLKERSLPLHVSHQVTEPTQPPSPLRPTFLCLFNSFPFPLPRQQITFRNSSYHQVLISRPQTGWPTFRTVMVKDCNTGTPTELEGSEVQVRHTLS